MIYFQDLIHPIQDTSNLSTWTQKVCIQMPFLSFVLKIISHNLTVVLQDRITSIVFIVPALTKKWAFNLDNTSCFAETVLLLIFFYVYAYVMMEFNEEDSKTSAACTLTWQLKHTCNSTIARRHIQQYFNTLTWHSWFFLWHRAVRLTSFLSCVSSSTHDFSPQRERIHLYLTNHQTKLCFWDSILNKRD